MGASVHAVSPAHPQAFGSSQDVPITIPRLDAMSAAAEADVSDAAVAVTRADLDSMAVTQPFKLNNIALKWLRDSNENPPGCPRVTRVDITDQHPLDIGVIERTTGMAYSFKDGETQPWSWRQMLSAMKREAKDRIVSHGNGVRWITCEPVDGSYDHKRWHAARQLGTPFPDDAHVPVWDFHVYRTDGVVVRFHTSLTNHKVEVAIVPGPCAPPGLPTPPAAGKGMSDGPGTYRRKTAGNYDAPHAREPAVAEAPAVAEPQTIEGAEGCVESPAPEEADDRWLLLGEGSGAGSSHGDGAGQQQAAPMANAQQPWEPRGQSWWDHQGHWWERKEEASATAATSSTQPAASSSGWRGGSAWDSQWKTWK